MRDSLAGKRRIVIVGGRTIGLGLAGVPPLEGSMTAWAGAMEAEPTRTLDSASSLA